MKQYLTPKQEVEEKGELLLAASKKLGLCSTEEKNNALRAISHGLKANCEKILAANALDVADAKERGISESLIDRLLLTEKRLSDIADSVLELIALPDPIGEIIETITRPNGMKIEKIRVPMGVIGMIYEARPNVTVDAAAIALKTGSAIMLRGSSSALHSNKCIVEVMKDALKNTAVPADAVELLTSPSHDSVQYMMKAKGILDLLIPRGGVSLIKTVVNNSVVPVIETGVGNCHLFIDASAEKQMAVNIAVNGKTQRPSVCNALETILVHKDWPKENLDAMVEALKEKGVLFAADAALCKQYPFMYPAEEADWEAEYLDLKAAIRLVDSIDDALEHIDCYGTKHTETIITEDPVNARRFMMEVDAAAVNHNITSRMTDGGMYGFGAEIGISTQKLHARGPMALKEITSYKYLVYGNGQIRE